MTSTSAARVPKSLRLLSVMAAWLLLAPWAQASQATTFTTLTILPNETVAQGTVLTLTASVSDGEIPVQLGTVTFYDGTRVLGEVAVVRTESVYMVGTGNLKFVLGTGPHNIKAVYSGGGGYKTSSSTTHSVTVATESRAATITTITSSGSSGNYTLKGKVSAYSSIAPTGSVTFKDQTADDATVGSALLDADTLTGGWQSFTPYAGDTSFGIVTGDLNGDGYSDIVTSNFFGTTITVLLGSGEGTFPTHTNYTVPAGPFGLALGDLDGDGFPDIAVASHDGSTVSILLSNGDGTFRARQDYVSSGDSQYVAVTDLNRDGKLDVISLSSANEVNVFLGNGNGTLKAKAAYPTGEAPFALAVGDFNGDGNPDVAVGNAGSATIGVLLGIGDGTLAEQVTYPSASNVTGLIAVDLNNDGVLDLAASAVNTVNVFLGNGDGTFQSKVDYASAAARSLAAGDVNGDGFIDIVASYPGNVDYFQGNGDGTLKPKVSTAVELQDHWLALSDLNGDGVLDLVLTNLEDTNVYVALGSLTETATATEINIQGQGTHKIFASYGGDETSTPSTSSTINLEGSQLATVVSLAAAPSPATVGQTVTLTATVEPAPTGLVAALGLTLSGTVTFYDDETQLGAAVTLVGGEAAMTKNDFAVGSHPLTAVYSGDSSFAGSTSSTTTLQVDKKTQTITFPAMNPVTYGVAPITLSATASSELAVSFSKVSGPGSVSGTTLTVTGAGSIVIQADQAGNANYQAAEPVQRTMTVNKAATTAAVVSSDLTSNLNGSVTFTATVDTSVTHVPSGTFSFMDGEAKLSDVEVDEGGEATYSTSALTAGTHSITAMYKGDTDFLTSTSPAISQVVAGPDYSIVASPTTISIKTGQSGTSILTFTPVGGYSGDVALTCSGLPAHAACTFVPSSISMSGDNAAKTTVLTVTTTDHVASMRPSAYPFSGFPSALALMAPLGLLGVLIAPWKWRSIRSVSFVLLAVALMGGVVGTASCGSSGINSSNAPPGTSHVTVTATASGIGGTNHSATVTITITN